MALAKALKSIGHVTVVAPEREQSTMGHALTLHKPIRKYGVHSEKNLDIYALSGTPADCVYMGIRHVLKKHPDIIISGINRGYNLGNDIYYSGTVAAAREGALLNIPSMATSMDYHYEPGIKKAAYFDDAAKGGKNRDQWHAHWVVLGKDDACKGGLKVIDIPKDAKPKVPETWPGVPLLIDSPNYLTELSGQTAVVRVPVAAVSAVKGASFDGVTAGLRVNANLHAPLLCVENVFKIASGNLSLPGKVE